MYVLYEMCGPQAGAVLCCVVQAAVSRDSREPSVYSLCDVDNDDDQALQGLYDVICY